MKVICDVLKHDENGFVSCAEITVHTHTHTWANTIIARGEQWMRDNAQIVIEVDRLTDGEENEKQYCGESP